MIFALVVALSQAPQMPHFASDSAMTAYLQRLMGLPSRAHAPMNATADAMGAGQAQAAPMARSITNVQTAGVDEGDIVKLAGNYFVILRRGRLFTVSIADGRLRQASVSDAFGRGIDPDGTWYDEMLIAGDRVVVLGYSYARGGTEVGVFRLTGDGALRYEQTFQLRSNDYYSSRNYASRLVGTKLIYYAPLYGGTLPGMQRWSRSAAERGFHPTATPERVFYPAGWRGSSDFALHTVTTCDLATPDVQCSATVVIGPAGNVFYVSDSAVYVWTTSLLTRIPLDGSAPRALKVSGSPVDQFSFLDSGDGYLNVLTIAGAAGDNMWGAEFASGPPSLLRLPLDSLGDGSRAAPLWMYRRLPTATGGTFQNRFVGGYLLYGTGSGWGSEEPSSRVLFAVPWRGGDVSALHLASGIDRIEVMGERAVVVGVRDTNLVFSSIALEERPRLAQRYVLANASQGELRSHGFSYNDGVIGLPVREENVPGWRHLVEGSASVVFLSDQFRPVGRLEARAVTNNDDGCRASCVDWYGNARPIFAGGRVFALLGYELVEGRLNDGVMREIHRVNFGSRLLAARPVPGASGY